jgi:hypothetical protein
MLVQYLARHFSVFLICLFPVFAAPITESPDETGLVARTAGSSRADPIQATFDITGWEGIAEENCYAMLCLLDGERTW